MERMTRAVVCTTQTSHCCMEFRAFQGLESVEKEGPTQNESASSPACGLHYARQLRHLPEFSGLFAESGERFILKHRKQSSVSRPI